MSRYDVYVPGRSDAQLEAVVRQLGGFLTRQPLGRGEKLHLATPEWQKHIGQASELISRFQNPPAESRMRIYFAMGALTQDLLVISNVPDINWDEFQTIVANALRDGLREEIPKEVTVFEASDGFNYSYGARSKYPHETVIPRDVILLMKYYGLTGEPPRSIKYLAQENTLSPSKVRRDIFRGRIYLTLNPTIREFLKLPHV